MTDQLELSYGRICTCVKQGLWLYKIVQRLKGEVSPSVIATISMPTGSDMAECRDSAYEHAETRVAQWATNATWDAYVGMMEDCLHEKNEEDRKQKEAASSAKPPVKKLPIRPEDIIKQTAPELYKDGFKECFESMNKLRNYLAHEIGYIDNAIPRPARKQDELEPKIAKGATLVALLGKDEKLPDVITAIIGRKWETPGVAGNWSKNRRVLAKIEYAELEQFLCTVVALARLTLKTFERENPSLFPERNGQAITNNLFHATAVEAEPMPYCDSSQEAMGFRPNGRPAW